MRREGKLWAKFIGIENLHLAARRALKGKRSRADAAGFHADLERQLLQLREALQAGIYYPGAYRTFWISDPKRRLISAAPFRDRVVHHALIQVMEPVFERGFVYHSYACRKGKGTHRALRQFVTWARASDYVLKLDIKKYFASIDHAILKMLLTRKFKDPRLLRLSNLIVDKSNAQERVIDYFPGDALLTPLNRRKGLPIGNLTSQVFANVYLDPLDHFVSERCGFGQYLRYMDDIVICCRDKNRLQGLRNEIHEYLLGLRLRLNENKSRIRRLGEGVEFLGFVVRPQSIRWNQTSVRRHRRRMKQLKEEYCLGGLNWSDVARSLQAVVAHGKHGDTSALFEDVFYRNPFMRA